MRLCLRAYFYLAIVIVSLCSYGSASSLRNDLLPLVPPHSQIVAGFENVSPSLGGRLLLTTRNNRMDLDDWQALAGVDHDRIYSEFIQVAASPTGNLLTEHMLLVAGHFDRERIFRSIEQNGAQCVNVQGQTVLVIKPFSREQQDMPGVRWLTILDNRVGVLGTPDITRRALERYANHALPDAVLEERLSQLRPDVTSWNVLSAPPNTDIQSMSFAEPNSAWALLMENADLVIVGARFGPKIRVDFSVHSADRSAAVDPAGKAALIADLFPVGVGPTDRVTVDADGRPEHNPQEANWLCTSVKLTRKRFAQWKEQEASRRYAAANRVRTLREAEAAHSTSGN